MKWTPVESSCLAGVAYDRKTKTLHVIFKHGGTYSYSNIGTHRWQKLKKAESVGKYFNEAIKPRKKAA
jgi:hypothetical protein